MKTIKTLSIIVALVLTVFCIQNTNAQVRVGGGISIDIGFPEVVIVDRPQRRVPTPAPAPRRIPERRPDRRVHRSLGEISNHFRGGNITQQVVNVQVFENRRGLIDVEAYLRGGDVLTFTSENNNFNDVNYHFNGYRNRRGSCNNRILEVRFNNNLLPLRDGHISLQPQGRNGYYAVLNLHNRMGDSFHGNFSTY